MNQEASAATVQTKAIASEFNQKCMIVQYAWEYKASMWLLMDVPNNTQVEHCYINLDSRIGITAYGTPWLRDSVRLTGDLKNSNCAIHSFIEYNLCCIVLLRNKLRCNSNHQRIFIATKTMIPCEHGHWDVKWWLWICKWQIACDHCRWTFLLEKLLQLHL